MSVVRVEDIRAEKLCMSGARDWFQTYGLSWQVFLEGGYSIEDIEATKDELAYRVTARTRAREAAL